MKQKSVNYNLLFKCCFVLGLILYLGGLFLIFGSSFKSLKILSLFGGMDAAQSVKLIGIILFAVGFFMFLAGLVYFYKSNKLFEQNKDLIIEGKADMITIMVMTYLMIFMVIICIILDELVGALLFGICIVVQSVINMVLLKVFSKHK